MTGTASASVDLVAGPTTGGVILAFETGRQLGTRGDLRRGGPRRRRRRPARVPARVPRSTRGERVLLVDDILTTGGSLLAMIPAVEEAGGEIVDCHVLVDRSGGLTTLTSPRQRARLSAARAVGLDLPT